MTHAHAVRPAAVLLALGFPLASAAGQDSAPGAIAITNVTVLPMDRARLVRDQTVVVEGRAITRIGQTGRVPVPEGARVIDGTGKYLMPGIVDVHVHLAGNPAGEQRALLALFLAQGVTTVVNLRGTPQILELREAVNRGRVLGPTIYTAGPYVNEPFVTTPEDVERVVVDQKRAGYDFVKLHGNLSLAAYARLTAVGRREGIRVVGHAPRNLGLDAMFEERQYALAHAEEFIYDTTNSSRDVAEIEREIADLARSTARARIWLMPNFTAFKNIALQVNDLGAMLARPEMRFLPPSVREGWGPATNPYTNRIGKEQYPHIMAYYRLLGRLVRVFHAQGVRLLIGTDAMNTGTVPGFSAHDELEEFVAAGLTPFDALRAATANAADFLAVPEQHGTVAAGQHADLLLLDANPLENVSHTRGIAGVMVRGRWLSRGDLARMLDELARGGTVGPPPADR